MNATATENARRALREDDVASVSTIGDLLVRNARERPTREALVMGDARRSYDELLQDAIRSARSLLGLGIRPGQRVGLLMPNCIDFVELYWGCALIGVRILGINARLKAAELSHVLRDSDVVAVLTTDVISEYVDFVPLLVEATSDPSPVLADLVMIGASRPDGFVDRDSFHAAGSGVSDDDVHHERRSVRVGEECLMLYTSGTTTMPKGCALTHEALTRTASALAERLRLGEHDRMWCPLPMFHMGGILPMTTMFTVGGADVSMEYFEPGHALELLAGEQCTFAWPAFPTFTQGLIHHPSFAKTDLSRVRGVLDTGSPEALHNVQRAWPSARVVSCFGSTEVGGLACASDPDDPVDVRLGSGGLPFRGLQVRIVDPDAGRDLPPGDVGEIVVRGPSTATSYHNDPEKTAEAFREGWLFTGDLGRLDGDGRLTYVGRLKDMLKVGGENVAAVEIETFLGSHPAVKIAQVVGVPDDYYLEVPAAFIELAPGAAVSQDELVQYCKGKIATFKIPHYFRFVTDWPLSATKIQKYVLRERIVAELQATLANVDAH